MKSSGLFFYNLLGHYIVFNLASTFVSVSAPSLFGHWIAPHIWLYFAAYFALYRPIKLGLPLMYVVSFFTAAWTSAPLATLAASTLILYAFLYTLKVRIFWDGVSFYWLSVAVSAIAWPFLSFFLSFAFEIKTMGGLSLIDLLFRSLITVIAAPPFFFVLKWIDRKTEPQNDFSQVRINL